MMRRVASHYTYYRQLYRLHYVELDNQGAFAGVFPLEGEIAGTEFYDGILVPVACDKELKIPNTISVSIQWETGKSRTILLSDVLKQNGFSLDIAVGDSVQLLFLTGISLPSAEFCTDNSRSNGYIKRL